MSQRSDIETVEAAYRALTAGDLHGLLDLIHPDVRVYHAAKDVPWGGAYHGIEEFKEFLGRVAGAMDSTLEMDAVFEAGERVVGVGRAYGTLRANGASFDAREVNVWHVRDGKILTFEVYLDAPVLRAALAKQP